MKSDMEIAKKKVEYSNLKHKMCKVCLCLGPLLCICNVFVFWYFHRFTRSVVDFQHH